MASDNPQADMTSVTPRPRVKKRWPLVLLLAVLLGSGWGWWRFVVYPTTPEYAADRFLRAAHDRNYDTLYALIDLPGAVKTVLPNAGALKRVAEAAPGAIPTVEDYRITRCQVNGDTAKLDVTVTTSGGVGASEGVRTISPYTMPMVRVHGGWRVDGGWIIGEMARKGARALLRSIVF